MSNSVRIFALPLRERGQLLGGRPANGSMVRREGIRSVSPNGGAPFLLKEIS